MRLTIKQLYIVTCLRPRKCSELFYATHFYCEQWRNKEFRIYRGGLTSHIAYIIL